MKRIIASLLVFLLITFLASCASTPSTTIATTIATTTTIATNPPTALESLSDYERELFDCFLIGVDSVYVPTSARIVKCGKPIESTNGYTFVSLLIQAENKVGGTVSSIFNLKITGTNIGELLDNPFMDDVGSEDPNINVGKINKALAEHWEDLGLG